MFRSASLFLVLGALWLLLSGYFEPLLLGLGLASCLLVSWISYRMDVTDHEGHPIHLTWRALIYWPWLLWEIVKSNIDVAKVILAPSLPISPSVFTVKASQKDELGQVIYANSITLTPGTVAMDILGRNIEVHALTREGQAGVETGEMDRKVTWMEGAF